MPDFKVAKATFTRLASGILEEYKNVSTPDITDAMSRFGAMDPEIKPILGEAKMVGQALTVRTRPGDNLILHFATEEGGPGLVLVIDGGGYTRHSIWGGLMTLAASKKGLEGVVIDGAVRDLKYIRQLGYPIFARAVSPMNGSKEGPGEVNCPIQCGGCVVNPGDLIVGDDDGVAVVPLRQAGEILTRAKSFADKTVRRTNEIESGKQVVPKTYLEKVRERLSTE